MTVLTTVDLSAVATDRLIERIARFNADRLARDQGAAAAASNGDINAINLEADKLRDLAPDLKKVVAFLDDVVTRAEAIRLRVVELLSQTFKARNGDSLSFDSHAAIFDSLLHRLIASAENTRNSPNLLGTQPVSAFVYRADITGTAETVTRSYLGTDYYIDDTTGKRWIPDRDTNILRQRNPNTGAATGTYANITSGLRLDSIAGTTVTFTIAPDTASAQAFTGTLTTSGLAILDAWLYDGLSTTAGRARATTDLNYAKVTIDAQLPKLRGALATARFREGAAGIALDAATSRIDAATSAQALALQEADALRSQQYNATVTALRGAQALRKQYLQMLTPGVQRGVFTALIDVLA